MPPPTVALAGATGNLGLPILHALLTTSHPVTVLSRSGSKNTSRLPIHPNLTIHEVDFANTQSLTTALQISKPEIVISCLATLAIGSQNPLIDACIAAGTVHRFIPAEFGMDSLNPLCMALPVCQPKVSTQAYLTQQTRLHPHFSWTGIANGLFLDWGLKVGFIADVAKREVMLYNGGNVPFSVTTLAGVARAVLGVMRELDGTRNRVVYVHEAVVTQELLVRIARERDGREWRVGRKDTEVLRGECFALLDRGEVEEAMLGFCAVASWDRDYGCDFSRRLDNELLGVEILDEAGVRAVVESLLE